MDGIESCISFVVSKATQSVNRRARALLAPFEATPMQYAVLSAIRDRSPVAASDLIRRLDVDTATVTGIVDRLEVAGLIARSDHPSDRRIRLLAPTRKGKAAVRRMDAAMDTLNDDVAVLLGADHERVLDALRTLSSSVEER